MGFSTKQAREKSRAYQFEYMLKNGYQQTEGKNVVIFFHPSEFYVKTFYGTAANHTKYIKFRTVERMQTFINETIKNSESREAFKAEQKEKNKGKLSSHAATADAIRQELKTAFPGVKFSVKSESFAGGNSVHVSYENGPTSDKVNDIVKKYQYGNFNGMEDIYEYSNSREDIPQAKYVSASRNVSEDFKAEILRQVDSVVNYDFEPYGHNSKEQFIYRLMAKCDIPQNYEAFTLNRTNVTCGHFEEFWSIDFECKHSEPANIEPVKVEPGKIQIIEHPKRAGKVLVVGETYAIKDSLKAAGGWWNKWEKGWEFKADKIEDIKAVILQAKQPQKSAECSEVLQEMDKHKEADYPAALAKVLTLYPSVNRAELENELQAFI